MKTLSMAAGIAGLIAVVFAPCGFAAGPYIYVANAGEDTVSKIDVTGSGNEVARYPAWFTSGTLPSYFAHLGNAHAGAAPSRIVQNSLGDVYVLDRFFSNYSYVYWANSPNKPHLPVLLKITPSPTGATSSGSAVIPMQDGNNNYDIDTTEITDTAIVWAKPVGIAGTNLTSSTPTYNDEITLGRALATDSSGAVWVGMFGDTTGKQGGTSGIVKPGTAHYYKYNSNGTFLAGPIDTKTHTPYGAQIDIKGTLWSVDEGYTLAEINTSSNTLVAIHNHSSYGQNYSLSIYNDCSVSPPKIKIYLSERNGKSYIVYDPQTNSWSNAPTTLPQLNSLSVAVDSQGNVISGAITGEVMKVSPSGTLVWDTSSTPGAGPTVSTSNLHGLIVDPHDDVWAVDLANSRVVKYSGSNGKLLNSPTGLKVGDSPYTYGNPPPPTCAGVSPTPTPTPTISPTPTPTPTPAGCAVITGRAICQPDGSYSYTFTVTNNSAGPVTQILLTSTQSSMFTLSPQLTNLSTPLQNGQSTTVTTNIGHVRPGDKVCFFASLMSEKTQCCIVEVCPILPQCGDISPTPTLPPPPSAQMPRGKRRP
jgi:hypothetical protein